MLFIMQMCDDTSKYKLKTELRKYKPKEHNHVCIVCTFSFFNLFLFRVNANYAHEATRSNVWNFTILVINISTTNNRRFSYLNH